MLETGMYVRKSFEVEAVQVTEENMQQVAQWCNGTVYFERQAASPPYILIQHVHRPVNDRQTKAYSGDWVLKLGSGWKIYTDGAFKNTFEKKAGVLIENHFEY